MKGVLVRRRLVRIGIWTVLIMLLLAWAVSIAVRAPWTPWLTPVVWAAIGIGFLVRIARGSQKKRGRLDAFRELNQIYQGRTQTPYVDGSSAESAEVGHPLPGSSRSSE